MRNDNPEQHNDDERDAAIFRPDTDDADICGPDDDLSVDAYETALRKILALGGSIHDQ